MKNYKFNTLPEEKETIIVYDHAINEVLIYTSYDVIANRLYKKLGNATIHHETGAEWKINPTIAKKIPASTFTTYRKQ